MKTIAIIEDDQPIGDLLEEALGQAGYATLRAYSGTEAQYLLERAKPDLILLDLMLPGLTGEELLPCLGEIPVIVVSAKVGVDDKVNALLTGAADYVSKPFAMRELLARIAVQLRGPRGEEVPCLAFEDLMLDPATRQVTVGGRAGASHQDGICALPSAAPEPRAGVVQVGNSGANQPGHAGLHGGFPEAAHEQPQQKAAGSGGTGVH